MHIYLSSAERVIDLNFHIVMLPPGLEEFTNVSYGELVVHVGKLNYLDVLRKEGNVRVRFGFFGERGAGHLLVP